MIYKIRHYQMYSDETPEYAVDLGDLKLCRAGSPWKCARNGRWVESCLWTVFSKHDRKLADLLPGFRKCFPVWTYELPYGMIMLSMSNVEFIGPRPDDVTADALNELLRPVMDGSVWVEIQCDNLEVLQAYRCVRIDGPDSITLCYVNRRRLYADRDYRYRSITFAKDMRVQNILNRVDRMSDHVSVKLMTGKDGAVLWNTLVNRAMADVVYDPSMADPDYAFDYYKKRYEIVREELIKKLKVDIERL